MKTAAEIAEEAIAKIDNEDTGNAGDQSKGDDDKKPEDAADNADKSKSTTGDDDESADNKTDDKSKVDKDEDDEGTFTADDALEEEVKTTDTKTDQPTDSAGITLSPAESKYIADNIGEPLVIRGIRGEGDDAKEVELKVFTPDQIPRDFKFQTDADIVAAQTGFGRLEQRAQQLLGTFRNNQSNAEAADFEKRENQGIRDDVADLQKAGDFPKFKIQPGQPGFENDPAAKQMAEVLNVMTERNEQYLKEYQQGRPYRHIGFREAFEIYQAKKPAAKVEKDQKQEDEERHKVANKVGSNRGLSSEKVVKPTIPSGTTIQDILNKHDSEDW